MCSAKFREASGNVGRLLPTFGLGARPRPSPFDDLPSSASMRSPLRLFRRAQGMPYAVIRWSRVAAGSDNAEHVALGQTTLWGWVRPKGGSQPNSGWLGPEAQGGRIHRILSALGSTHPGVGVRPKLRPRSNDLGFGRPELGVVAGPHAPHGHGARELARVPWVA